MKAFKIVFPVCDIKLCLFHFVQALFRKIEEPGLTHNYKNDTKVKLLCKLPPIKVKIFFEIISRAFLQLHPILYKDFLIYFKKSYINISIDYFNIDVWSAYSRCIDKLPLTTNNLEGFNSSINKLSECSHPSLINLLPILLSVQSDIETKMAISLTYPLLSYSSDKTMRKMNNINDIIQNFDS
jgi:hypothetical protein